MLLSLNNNSLGLRMTNPGKKTLSAALASIFFTAGLGVGVNAYGAGLGRLTVSSALGQPLVAEIELVSLLPGEFESLSAKVASPDAYRSAKIEYSSVLRLLKFVPEMRADGKPILRVTSTAPVSEPFVDVLVEMVWPSGKLLREYPILLDPPGFSEAKVSQAPVAGASKPASTVVASPVTQSSAPPSRVVSSTVVSSPDSYGPVKAGDTLSKIAASVKPDSVSLEQMLVALYRENKDAFSGNVNRLKKGQILRVPSAGEVNAIPQAEAKRELSVQVANWREYREKVGNDVSAAPAKSTATSQAAGKIGGVKPDVAPAVATGKDSLKLSKSDTSAAAGGAGSKGGTGDQLNAMREEGIAKDNRLKEANSRVADLEKQIATMKALIDAKGLAAPKTADTKVAKAEPPKVEPPKVEPLKAVAAVTPAKVEPAKVEPVKVVEPPKTEVAKVEPAKVDPAKPADPPKADVAKADTKVVDPKADMPKPAAPKVVAKPPPKVEATMIDGVSDTVTMAGGAGILALLGGLGFMFARRKKKPVKGDGTSAIKSSSVMPDDLKPNTVTGNRAGGLVDTGNSSFLTDFDKAAPGAIDTDDVDPVAEADVYIAYGRDAQAETILKEAMERDKGRHEIAVKLLEIYHARKSAASFEGVATQLRAAVGDGHPMWARACAMGSQIDPANPLYNSAANALGATGAFAAASSIAAASTSNPPSLDFDLGFDDKANNSATIDLNSTNPGVQMPATMDFDLDLGFNDDADKTVVANPNKTAAASSTLDFDLGFDDIPAAAPIAAKAAPTASSFDFALSSLKIDVPSDSEKTQRIAKPEAAAMASKPAADSFAGMSLDLGSSATASAENAGAAATKIELAKAYVEIGDKDGAKEILNEVIREGNAAQQAEAKKIIAGM